MDIKKIFTKFKNSEGTEKLAILSDLITIFTAVVTLITAQYVTLKFVIDETTFIKIAYYIIAMGMSLSAIYLLIEGVKFVIKYTDSFLIKVASSLIFSGGLILILVTIWSFILSIQ